MDITHATRARSAPTSMGKWATGYTTKEKADWELEALHETIQRAYALNMPITFTLYQQNKWQTTTGFITTIDVLKKHLLLETDTTIKAIPFQVIQEAEVDD